MAWDVEKRLVIWLQQILSIWRLNPPFGSVSPPPQLLKWSYMAKLRHKATTFLMSHSALGFSGFVPGFLNKGPCITRYSTVAWPCPQQPRKVRRSVSDRAKPRLRHPWQAWRQPNIMPTTGHFGRKKLALFNKFWSSSTFQWVTKICQYTALF
jgi:hypothetical protein